jgi:antitoxin component YwqK of YwqJK toxin-antitoxin module
MQLTASLAALALVLLQDPLPDPEGPPLEARTETHADGKPKAEYQVRVDEDGRDVLHGDYTSWFPNEQMQARGRHKDGHRVGIWETWYDTGQLESEGNYRRGLRHGEWRYYLPDGKLDIGRKVKYTAVHETWEDGTPKLRGEKRLKFRHGPWTAWRRDGSVDWRGEYKNDKPNGEWTWYAADGSVRLRGEYKRGKREGTWAFTHPNGLVDPEFVSGSYKKDVRRKGAPQLLAAPLTPDAPGLDVAALPPPAPFAGLAPSDYAVIEGLLDRFTGPDEAQSEEALTELLTWEITCLPAALERLRALDLASQADALLGYRVTYSLLSGVTGGHVFEWKSGTSEADRVANRLALVRWHTLWELTGGDSDFWETVLGTDAEEEPDLLFALPIVAAEVGRRATPVAGEAPVEAPSAAMRERELLVHRRDLMAKHGGKGTTDALEAALAWLAAHQDPASGGWDADGFMRQCPKGETICEGIGQPHNDVGVSGLALLALTGGGHTNTVGEFADNVAAGLRFLLGRQNQQSGLIGATGQKDAIYGHGIATMALLAAGDHKHPKLREAVEKAIAYIVRGQNEGRAWRYDVPPTGDNDTSVTGWIISALSMAEQHGYRVPPHAFVGALAWLDDVTEETTGRVGYDSIGSLSARTMTNQHYPRQDQTDHPAETMTAVAAWIRVLAGQAPADEKQLEKHFRLLSANPPLYEPDALGNDVYYWYYGTYAMFQLGGKGWKAWNDAMKTAVRASQRQNDHPAGSWDPIGPWGYAGGRVYTTAMMALCLEVYWRYPRTLD